MTPPHHTLIFIHDFFIFVIAEISRVRIQIENLYKLEEVYKNLPVSNKSWTLIL